MATAYPDDRSMAAVEPVGSFWKLTGDGTKLRLTGTPLPATAPSNTSRTFQVDARFETAGVWAGVDELVEAAYLDLLAKKLDQVIDEHDYELYMVLLNYRDRLYPKYMNLTDVAPSEERTRRYAVDRAYRIVNGLVGLILQWRRASHDTGRWVIIVRHFDDAQHLSARFFTDLARRIALHGDLNIDVIVETKLEPAEIAHRYPALRASPTPKPHLEPAADHSLPATMAEHIERQGEQDTLVFEQNCFALLAYYGAQGNDFARAQIAFKILPIFIAYGYYYEAEPIIDIFMPFFDRLIGDDQRARGKYVGFINSCLGNIGYTQRLPEVVEELGLPYITTPHVRASMYYILAIYYLRTAEIRDPEASQKHFDRLLEQVKLAKDDPTTPNYPFLKVFMDNGLALLRVRQGRHQEAIDLCTSGYAHLMRELRGDDHKLHRSVLQYNIGQVYVMLGRLEEGLSYYKTAMTADPYFTEYYNDVGNILQNAERYAEAIEYYESAIRYSAPYPEVYHNKGLCHAREGQWEEALICLDTSIELDPTRAETFAIRAEALEGLGREDDALLDYDSALNFKADFVAARVNRAILHFNKGSFDLALADMDNVISIESDEPTHYENRAEIHRAMGREDLYQSDRHRAEQCGLSA